MIVMHTTCTNPSHNHTRPSWMHRKQGGRKELFDTQSIVDFRRVSRETLHRLFNWMEFRSLVSAWVALPSEEFRDVGWNFWMPRPTKLGHWRDMVGFWWGLKERISSFALFSCSICFFVKNILMLRSICYLVVPKALWLYYLYMSSLTHYNNLHFMKFWRYLSVK